MKSLHRIVKEETIKFIKEAYENDDTDWDLYSRLDDVERELFNDFLYKNNADFSKTVPWTVIRYPRLKKIWEDFMSTGVVRDTRGLESIEDIMTENTLKISIFTKLYGHTPYNPEDDYEDNIGYFVNEQLNCLIPKKNIDSNQLEIPFENPNSGFKKKEPVPNSEPCVTQIHPYIQSLYDEKYEDDMTREQVYEFLYEEIKEKFFDYGEDTKIGQAYISDYGLRPLEEYLSQLHKTTKAEDKVVIIDKMLNVVHMRSDMASWFVEGGSTSLSQLSASPSEQQVTQQ